MAAVSTWLAQRQTSHNSCLMIRIGFFGAKPQNHASWNQLGGARILWSLRVSSAFSAHFMEVQFQVCCNFMKTGVSRPKRKDGSATCRVKPTHKSITRIKSEMVPSCQRCKRLAWMDIGQLTIRQKTRSVRGSLRNISLSIYISLSPNQSFKLSLSLSDEERGKK